MNNIHTIFLRALAGFGLAVTSAHGLSAQEVTPSTQIDQSAPASAVDLVDAEIILQELTQQVPSESSDLVEVEDTQTDLDLVDPQYVTPADAETDIGVNVEPEEISSLIEDASGIADIDYYSVLGATGALEGDHFFTPVTTKPTANALVKNENDTPKIYLAMKDFLTQGELPLSEEVKTAILSTYFDRKGELIYVTDEGRMAAFSDAKRDVEKQGLPHARYDMAMPASYLASYDEIKTLALKEIEAARFTIRYGKDMERGIVEPNSLGVQFDIVPKGRIEKALLADFAKSERPDEFFMALEPNDPDYATLKAELAKYEELYLAADAANVPQVPDVATLMIGDQGEAVEILRDRLAALGFEAAYPEIFIEEALADLDDELSGGDGVEIDEDSTADSDDNLAASIATEIQEPRADVFDKELAEAVRLYQTRAGLLADGIAGPQTLKTINHGPRGQMENLLIAMERHRWGSEDRSGRQIYVNLANYMAEVRDNNVKTFETRVVIGKNDPDYKTPEFHDEMEYLVINPEWNVPHSIGTREFLPIYQRGSRLNDTYKMLNSRGNVVDPATVDFNKYTAKTFPYRFVQGSGPTNALGNVKFIFPNKHNIYLHDTPAKSLFAQTNRAYSHGCVRVRDPIDLATLLMAPYYKNPRGAYDDIRATKKQRFVEMTTRIPVFITYFTTYVDDAGIVRRVSDVYGRDRLVKNALAEQGVIF